MPNLVFETKYVIEYKPELHLYLKNIGINKYVWVDIFDATHYETQALAQAVANTLQVQSTVISVEVTNEN